jgi:RimJ/RimL family protein N-acetyltransferase
VENPNLAPVTPALAVSVPRIETGRLLLRELRTADFELYAAHLADPVAMSFTDGVVDRRVAWRLYASMAGGWVLNRAGWWAVELRETQRMVGVVGAFFRETKLPGPDSDLELGWSIFREHWRRGIAGEAARAALDHGLANHEVRRAIAHISAENVASIAVGRSLGMRHLGQTDFYGDPLELYGIERPSAPISGGPPSPA